MRSFAGAGFVSVDERAVFGRCLSRWENSGCQLLRDRQLRGSWVGTGCWCRRSCPQCGVWPRSAVRGCAPMMGAAVVVRNAELHPGISWVCTNHGCIWGCPQCGVWTVPGLLWVRCWSSGGGRVCRCSRAYSTSGTRLSPHRRRHRGCVCWPRNLYGRSLAGRGPPGGSAPGFSWVCANDGCHCGCPQCGVWPGHGIGWCAPMMGAGAVVRNAELHPGLSWVSANSWCIWCCPQCGV